jgi:Tfp pilus assembly protein PilX
LKRLRTGTGTGAVREAQSGNLRDKTAKAIAAFALATLAGCSFDTGALKAPPPANTDAGADIAQNDTGPQPDAQKPQDVAAQDRGMDTQVSNDSGPDALPQADSGMDALVQSDSGADSAVSCTQATTGTFDGSINTNASQNVGGYIFTYRGKDASGNALFDITCGGSDVADGKACPTGADTVIDVPADGKRITIHPAYASSMMTTVTINIVNI